MQSKDRRIIIYFGMNESKNDYRTISKEIWTRSNILKKEDIINTNLGEFLLDQSKIIMAYISMKDEVNILPCIKDLSSLQIPYTHKDKIGKIGRASCRERV